MVQESQNLVTGLDKSEAYEEDDTCQAKVLILASLNLSRITQMG